MIDTTYIDIDKHLLTEQKYRYVLNTIKPHENLKTGFDPAVHIGRLKNMRVKNLNDEVRIEGSLAKEIHGNNVIIPSLDEILNFLEITKHEYGLPLMSGTFRRIDFGYNFLMDYPVKEYLNCFQETPGYSFSRYKGNVYYQKNNYELIFYDKGKEIRNQLQYNPTLSKLPSEVLYGNLLRYEIRFTSRLYQIFDFGVIKPLLLHSSSFRRQMFEFWIKSYFAINKTRAFIFDTCMDTVPKLKNQVRLHGIAHLGGLWLLIENLRALYKTGAIEQDQFYTMTAWLRGKGKQKDLISEGDFISELNDKISGVSPF